jgi:hypothetical protein
MPVVKPACSSDTLDLNPKGARELMSLFPGSCALDFHRRRDTTAAYVAGQLLSPYAKLVQRIGESELVQGIARSKFGQKIGKRLGFNPKPMPNAPSGAYDWLRCEGKRHIVLRRPQAAAYGHLVRQPLTEVAAIGSARCTGSGRRKPSTGAR